MVAAVPETANAPVAGAVVVSSASSNVTVSAVPLTEALENPGRTPSTLCADCAASAAWVRSASLLAASSMSPPLRSSAFCATAMPSVSASPSATTYSNTSAVEPVPESYTACRVSVPSTNAMRGPVTGSASVGAAGTVVTVTFSLNVAVSEIVSPMA